MAKIDKYLLETARSGASDLHIRSNYNPITRLHGKLVRLDNLIISQRDTALLINEILTKPQKKALEENRNIDLAYQIEDFDETHRFRGCIYYQRYGLDAVFRVIPKVIKTLDELELPKTLNRFTKLRQGLVLITGPTGCGKTTTLAAMLEQINRERNCHIITLEDPIEYIFKSKKSLINQRQIGLHTKSFYSGVKATMREDPDIILIGELRDLETIQMAITAAETGHLVFATLHTASSAKTVDRIINTFPAKQQNQIRMMLSDSLKGVISQRLIPKKSEAGRIAAVEILIATLPIASLIREDRTFQIPSIMQTGKNAGMQIMDEVLLEYAEKNIISVEEALLRAENKEIFDHLIKNS